MGKHQLKHKSLWVQKSQDISFGTKGQLHLLLSKTFVISTPKKQPNLTHHGCYQEEDAISQG